MNTQYKILRDILQYGYILVHPSTARLYNAAQTLKREHVVEFKEIGADLYKVTLKK